MKPSIIALSVLAIPALAVPLLTQPEKKSSATEIQRTTGETSLRIVAPPSASSVGGPAVAVAPSRPSAPKNLRIRTTGH
jgi:hypothetical protein